MSRTSSSDAFAKCLTVGHFATHRDQYSATRSICVCCDMISDTHTPYAYWSSDMTLSRVDGFFDNRSHRSCAVDASSSSSPKTSFSSHVSNLLQGSFRFFSSYHFNRFSRNTTTTEEEDDDDFKTASSRVIATSFSPLVVIKSPAAAAAPAAARAVVLVEKDKDDGETFFSPAREEDEMLVVGKTKERRRSREIRNTATRSCSREEQKKLLRMHAYVSLSLSLSIRLERARARVQFYSGDFFENFHHTKI